MKIELPHVGESVTEAIIGKWLKQVGDRVEKYDPLVEVVTDKVTMEVPSPEDGLLICIMAQEGETVPMGSIIASMDVDNEEAQIGPGSPIPSTPRQSQIIDRTGILVKDMAPVGPTGSDGPPQTIPDKSTQTVRTHFSPAVIRLAAEQNVDLSLVSGTGINGRITQKDVREYINSNTAPEEASATVDSNEERVLLTPVRRLIADNMAKSAREIPEAWTVVSVDVTRLVRIREREKGEFEKREGVSLTYLPFMLSTVANALKENPLLNSTWDGDAIVLKHHINIGVAIATQKGLVVPVIHNADTMDIASLAKVIDDLTTRARRGKLAVNDMQGGTFTVNNTGSLGSVIGKAIINYPQAAILNTESIVKKPTVINDAIEIRSMMNLCLTFDHRVMDGAEAGTFINGVKERLEKMGEGVEHVYQ